MTTSAYALTSQDWAQTFTQKGYPLTGLSYWLDGLYKDATLWKRHVASGTVSTLTLEYDFSLPEISLMHESEDGTVKFQMKFADGLEVETVLIPFHKRFTVCLSTQVGCAMNCSFCYTGTQGLKRHLSAGEIVGQYLRAQKWLREKNPEALSPSIVFMGQGEPLHNGVEVKKAVEVLNDTRCVGLGVRQMTLSTVGFVPGIKTLSDYPKINFALSLHSPFDDQRDELIPLNKKYPLSEVLNEIDQVPHLKKKYVTFEYLMIQNYNMSDAHAEALHEKLGHRKAMINLIPFNPFPGSKWKRPTNEEIETFKQKLVSKRLRVMVRSTKGDDILAACGQLKINTMARNYGHE